MKPLVAVVVALAVAAASCGSGDSAESDSSTTTTTTTTASTTSTSAAPTTTLGVTPLPSIDFPAETNIEVATINVLHGLIPPVSGCEEYTDQCNSAARLDILWDYLDTEVGCPEIIALQEIAVRWFELVPEKLPDLCEGSHTLLTEDLGLFDQEMILTTLPVIEHRRIELAGAPVWSAHWAQLDAGDGFTVDVFGTHYASSAFNPQCSPEELVTTCHTSCPADSDLGNCHPYETLAFFAEQGAAGSLQLLIGDLNQQIDEPRLQTLTAAGFIDTYLAAGNPECPPEGGVGCSSGIGGDTDLDGLDIADQTPRGRIDFVLARPPDGCDLLVDIGDADGDGTTTGHWADTPLATPVEGLYWASDHVGVQADLGLSCD